MALWAAQPRREHSLAVTLAVALYGPFLTKAGGVNEKDVLASVVAPTLAPQLAASHEPAGELSKLTATDTSDT